MKITYLTFFYCIFPLFTLVCAANNENRDYLNYHRQVIEAESLIAEEKYGEALSSYENVINSYEFVFLRDYQVAAQLAFYLNERQKALRLLEEGITAGWELKELKNNKFLASLQDESVWTALENNYDSLRSFYLNRIDPKLREKVHKMFKKDQKKALGALFRIGDKAQERYATKKFAPHSEIQMTKLINILENVGYPGEKLIGNDYWMSTILSHHNSISQAYSKKDTLYMHVRPKLIQAIETGQMSPFEFAMIDDWQKAVISNRTEAGYGFLNPPLQATLSVTDDLRQKIGLRTIELSNKLVDIEEKTGMNFYLPDWIQGRIIIEQK
ncbi:hypothetical protein [uncultured Eudoraea sp.]|uniref:hypothetical protein n=1 Tax=uncultured Eudoraea sp. TaxID=1035614 RepID=UPI00261495E9|nr:hypothetical protein [uncultured Eudoraea sp.]